MADDIKLILDEFVEQIKEVLGPEIQSIVLYGSYARGDFNAQSDVDIMILVNSSEDDIKKYENSVYDCAFELKLKYGKVISPIIKNQQFFEYWADTLPFYKNIVKEGVPHYVRIITFSKMQLIGPIMRLSMPSRQFWQWRALILSVIKM